MVTDLINHLEGTSPTGAEPFNRSLLAPCGINCGTCYAFLRDKNRCCGCWPDTTMKSKTRDKCIIKNCETLSKTESKFCYDCEDFPCKRMKQLDKRYRTRYNISLIQNLLIIKAMGIEEYLSKDNLRWTCKECGSRLCIHRDICDSCKSSFAKGPLT